MRVQWSVTITYISNYVVNILIEYGQITVLVSMTKMLYYSPTTIGSRTVCFVVKDFNIPFSSFRLLIDC